MNFLQKYQQSLGLVPDGIIGAKSAAAMMKDLGITDKLVFCHIMGQVKLESGMYTHFREDMHYSEPGLLNIFRKYYGSRPDLAKKHAMNPVAIANYVYANRNGNGDESSGDGYFYRGAFGLQITGKENFHDFFKEVGLPLNTDPDSLKDNPRYYFLAAYFWFKKNDAIRLCKSTSKNCILTVGRKVNLGNSKTPLMPHDYAKREQYTIEMFRAVGLV